MKPSALFLSALLGLFGATALAQALRDGWSRAEAEAKLGIRVQCVRNPDDQLLRWGPNFPGWARSRQPKALGRPVVVGTSGVIREIISASEGRYRLGVHWDAEKTGGPYWSTAIGPGQINVTAAALGPSDLVGRWREVGGSATIEFLEGGGFKAVDNEGMAVAGTINLDGDGKLSFAIRHDGSRDEIVNLDFSLIGDELTWIPAVSGSVERYRKER